MESNDRDVLGVLEDQYHILGLLPVPYVEGSGGSVYWVKQRAQSTTNMIALIGERADGFRIDIAERIKLAALRHFLQLAAWGVVDWQPDRRQRIALIFQGPPGSTLHQLLEGQRRRFTENEILNQILPPLIVVLRGLSEQGIVHGAIRPNNIYIAPSGTVTVGECISAPPSRDQPTQFLTIERALARPVARGAGLLADDVYALGVLIFSLFLGQIPLAELTHEEVIEQKIERGSFLALVGRQLLTNGLFELVRGMLDDDPQQRWGLDTIEHWIAGRRMVGSQALTIHRPSRGLIVNGVEQHDPRAIAEMFSHNVSEAMRLIANDELIKWVRRTLRDMPMAQRIADAVNMSHSGRAGSHEARLVARVIIALHPNGPIRYQGQWIMPDGLGNALASTVGTGESPQAIGEIIASQLPQYWCNVQPEFVKDHSDIFTRFERARQMLERPTLGAGLERCLYDLAPSAPFAEEGFDKYLIFNSRQFLIALEEVAGTDRRPSTPLGRQAVAFLLSRDEAMNGRISNRLIVATTDVERALGTLQILANLQKIYQIDNLPNLAQWLNTLMQPAIDRFHNRQTRETVKESLRKATNESNLTLMLSHVENPGLMQRDYDGFLQAWREYQYCEQERKGLEKEIEPGSQLYVEVGHEGATVVAALVSVVVVIGMVMIQIGQL